MSSLVTLWLVSLIISGIAIAIMMGLIVARLVSGRREQSLEAEKKRLVPLLLGVGHSDARVDSSEPASDLLADLSTELIQMVRGTDKQDFVASSSRLGVPERLRQRLDHGSPRTRLAAAEALADFGDDRSVERLSQALDDPNSDVRLAAGMALAEAGRAPPVTLLIEKLRIGTEENSMLVVGLFQEIAAQRPKEIKSLIESPGANASVKAAAIEALSASGDYSLVPAIVNLVLNSPPDAEELPRYLRALGDFGHPAAAKAVQHALGLEAWWARSAAAEAAGRIGLTASAPNLAILLEDPNWWVRFRAAEALARLGEDGLLLLREAAANGPDLARSTARLSLAERGVAP